MEARNDLKLGEREVRNLKIFIVSNSAWNIQNYRCSLIQDLENEFDVIVLSGGLSEGLFERARTLYFPTMRGKFWVFKCLFAFPLLVIYSLYYRPTAVVSFTAAASILSGTLKRLNLVPNHLATITGMGSLFIGGRYKKKIYLQILKSTLSSSDVFVQNKTDYKIFCNLVTQKTRVVPGSGVRRPVKINSKSRPDILRFGFVGRIVESKRVDLLLSAYASLPTEYVKKSSMNIYGDFDFSSQEKSGFKETLERGRNIHYRGWKAEKHEIYNEIDVNILLSTREGLPRSLVEGFSYGVPALVSNVPGCKDIVDHNMNGYVVQRLSVDEIVRYLMHFIDMSSETYVKLSNNARTKFQDKYTDENVNNYYRSYLSSMVK